MMIPILFFALLAVAVRIIISKKQSVAENTQEFLRFFEEDPVSAFDVAHEELSSFFTEIEKSMKKGRLRELFFYEPFFYALFLETKQPQTITPSFSYEKKWRQIFLLYVESTKEIHVMQKNYNHLVGDLNRASLCLKKDISSLLYDMITEIYANKIARTILLGDDTYVPNELYLSSHVAQCLKDMNAPDFAEALHERISVTSGNSPMQNIEFAFR